ncbi:polyketide antibiotic transporter [Georgenia subflava]|uniref:Polyketide antibiotic transporter n=1 Tax=Georgenia subflava TaxID=1622177 RepID=A0A6N7ELX8_9MICO|nr:polyketide antibiotic transporter [Georgenia subflava]
MLRLFLRVDRVRIIVWTLAFAVLVAGSVASLEVTYPTPESLQARAALLSNPSAVMMTGPLFAADNYTFGAMLANELALYIYLAAAIMSVLLVVRHTRAEEESGRLELLRALPVGRFAPATAALVTVALANLAVAVAVVAALTGTGMAVVDSAAMGLATALTGLVFGAVAAVTAQLTEHARTASGLAMGVLAVAFIVRGVGDVIDNQGSWLSWFSPLAWAQQTRVFVDLRWWPLALSAVATLLLLVLAVVLAQRRDLGAGLRPARPGPASASSSLLSPAGLARRLVSGTFLGWAIGLFLFAIAFGALANSLEGMIEEIPDLGEWFGVADLDDLTTSFASAMLSFLVIGPVALVVSGVLRLRTEEEAGRVEAVLVTGSSRPRLLAGWLAVVAVETVLVLLTLGLGVGIGVAAVTGDGSWVGRLAAASLAYVPAVLLVGAVAVALYGLVPRAAALAWVLVVWVAIVGFLGSLLDLPGWAADLSPLSHTPLVPAGELEAAPLLIMLAVAAALATAGFLGLRRRDVVS